MEVEGGGSWAGREDERALVRRLLFLLLLWLLSALFCSLS